MPGPTGTSSRRGGAGRPRLDGGPLTPASPIDTLDAREVESEGGSPQHMPEIYLQSPDGQVPPTFTDEGSDRPASAQSTRSSNPAADTAPAHRQRPTPAKLDESAVLATPGDTPLLAETPEGFGHGMSSISNISESDALGESSVFATPRQGTSSSCDLAGSTKTIEDTSTPLRVGVTKSGLKGKKGGAGAKALRDAAVKVGKTESAGKGGGLNSTVKSVVDAAKVKKTASKRGGEAKSPLQAKRGTSARSIVSPMSAEEVSPMARSPRSPRARGARKMSMTAEALKTALKTLPPAPRLHCKGFDKKYWQWCDDNEIVLESDEESDEEIPVDENFGVKHEVAETILAVMPQITKADLKRLAKRIVDLFRDEMSRLRFKIRQKDVRMKQIKDADELYDPVVCNVDVTNVKVLVDEREHKLTKVFGAQNVGHVEPPDEGRDLEEKDDPDAERMRENIIAETKVAAEVEQDKEDLEMFIERQQLLHLDTDGVISRAENVVDTHVAAINDVVEFFVEYTQSNSEPVTLLDFYRRSFHCLRACKRRQEFSGNLRLLWDLMRSKLVQFSAFEKAVQRLKEENTFLLEEAKRCKKEVVCALMLQRKAREEGAALTYEMPPPHGGLRTPICMVDLPDFRDYFNVFPDDVAQEVVDTVTNAIAACASYTAGYDAAPADEVHTLVFRNIVQAAQFALCLHDALRRSVWPQEFTQHALGNPREGLRGPYVRTAVSIGDFRPVKCKVSGRTRFIGKAARLARKYLVVARPSEVSISAEACKVLLAEGAGVLGDLPQTRKYARRRYSDEEESAEGSATYEDDGPPPDAQDAGATDAAEHDEEEEDEEPDDESKPASDNGTGSGSPASEPQHTPAAETEHAGSAEGEERGDVDEPPPPPPPPIFTGQVVYPSGIVEPYDVSDYTNIEYFPPGSDQSAKFEVKVLTAGQEDIETGGGIDDGDDDGGPFGKRKGKKKKKKKNGFFPLTRLRQPTEEEVRSLTARVVDEEVDRETRATMLEEERRQEEERLTERILKDKESAGNLRSAAAAVNKEEVERLETEVKGLAAREEEMQREIAEKDGILAYLRETDTARRDEIQKKYQRLILQLHQQVRRFSTLFQHYLFDPTFPFVKTWVELRPADVAAFDARKAEIVELQKKRRKNNASEKPGGRDPLAALEAAADQAKVDILVYSIREDPIENAELEYNTAVTCPERFPSSITAILSKLWVCVHSWFTSGTKDPEHPTAHLLSPYLNPMLYRPEGVSRGTNTVLSGPVQDAKNDFCRQLLESGMRTKVNYYDYNTGGADVMNKSSSMNVFDFAAKGPGADDDGNEHGGAASAAKGAGGGSADVGKESMFPRPGSGPLPYSRYLEQHGSAGARKTTPVVVRTETDHTYSIFSDFEFMFDFGSNANASGSCSAGTLGHSGDRGGMYVRPRDEMGMSSMSSGDRLNMAQPGGLRAARLKAQDTRAPLQPAVMQPGPMFAPDADDQPHGRHTPGATVSVEAPLLDVYRKRGEQRAGDAALMAPLSLQVDGRGTADQHDTGQLAIAAGPAEQGPLAAIGSLPAALPAPVRRMHGSSAGLELSAPLASLRQLPAAPQPQSPIAVGTATSPRMPVLGGGTFPPTHQRAGTASKSRPSSSAPVLRTASAARRRTGKQQQQQQQPSGAKALKPAISNGREGSTFDLSNGQQRVQRPYPMQGAFPTRSTTPQRNKGLYLLSAISNAVDGDTQTADAKVDKILNRSLHAASVSTKEKMMRQISCLEEANAVLDEMGPEMSLSFAELVGKRRQRKRDEGGDDEQSPGAGSN